MPLDSERVLRKVNPGLAQRILSVRPEAMFLKVGGVEHRQMRISHR